jgi:predicted transcriptional regulator
MAGWSIEDAVAMERRHVLVGEKMITRQEHLANELVGNGRDQLAQSANEVLVILRESLDLSRRHLSRLEVLLRDAPKSK